MDFIKSARRRFDALPAQQKLILIGGVTVLIIIVSLTASGALGRTRQGKFRFRNPLIKRTTKEIAEDALDDLTDSELQEVLAGDTSSLSKDARKIPHNLIVYYVRKEIEGRTAEAEAEAAKRKKITDAAEVVLRSLSGTDLVDLSNGKAVDKVTQNKNYRKVLKRVPGDLLKQMASEEAARRLFKKGK